MTTLLGLLWRRVLRGGSRAGTLAAVAAVAGAVGATGIAAAQLGSEFLFDQPQPTMTAVLAMADAVAVLAVAVLLSLDLVWRASGRSLGRRVHRSAFALALAGMAGLQVHWGLAFDGTI